jgi:hypothetical protein
MATTSLNPGVGPTNADIATAVAAPSAATIAAAVAAPSAATIASAVAAPSSATIASAVAAAVPTTAGITTIVQANAGSPFGGTYTNIANINPTNGSTSTTISGLSSYKYIKVVAFLVPTGAADIFIQINGNVAHHSTVARGSKEGTSPFVVNYQSNNKTDSFVRPNGGALYSSSSGPILRFEIKDNNAVTPVKELEGTMHYFENGTNARIWNEFIGHAWTTSAVSSITFLQFNNALSSSSQICVWGAN